MLADASLEGSVFVVSLDGLEVKVLSVVGDVLSQLFKGSLDSIDLRDKNIIDHIASIENILLFLGDKYLWRQYRSLVGV